MILAALMLIAGQAGFIDPPAPPPLAASGTPAFEREKAAYESELRTSCISKAGAAIIVSDWASGRADIIGTGAAPEWRRLERAVAQAAYASPVDMKRLEAAIRANAEYRAGTERRLAEDSIAILRRLSPADREIHARRSTLMLPVQPPEVCKVP